MAALRRLLWPPPRFPPQLSPHQPVPGLWGRPAGITPTPTGRPFSCREEEEGAVTEAGWRRRRRWGELSIAAAAGGGLVGLVCYQLYGDPRAESVAAPGRLSESSEGEPENLPHSRGLLPIPVAAAKETVAVGRTDMEDLDLYATSRERRFRLFASIECDGQLFMTPYDFILAVTTDEPKYAKTWKSFSKQLQEIFRKKNEKRETKGDEEKRALLRLQLYGYHSSTNS
ncbi:calcium uptake protein 3, mitochondrial-like, partial [Orycteropus afer afer]|uniref:Calcium uptake protein 3, mitochondrial-like n=1 Tax=Orycteropus afer afer TaxID=1230840 RepID=A0A8B7B4C2_ORYAF